MMIQLEHFTKYFHKGSINQVLALDCLDLQVREGDFVTIIGSNGAGKSTLLNGLAGTFEPDAGRLLLDEHTAALDPKTARQILELTDSIISERRLTTLMVTHNMRQALQMGNRLIMLHRGRIILDVRAEEKAALTQEDLVARFYDIQDQNGVTDRMLLG